MGRTRRPVHQFGTGHDDDPAQEAGGAAPDRDRRRRRLPPGWLSARRLSFKDRVALFCGALFLVIGIVLLCINYLLVRATLPGTDPASDRQVTTTSGPGSDPLVGPPPVGGGAITPQYREEVLNTLVVQSAVALAITLVLALVMGWFVARRVLRPVHEVAATARQLSADSLNQRIRMDGPRDELTELADTFDEMLDRLAGSFDSQRRFVANASHELRTPLAAQRTLVEVAMARPSTDQATRDLGWRLLAMNTRIESLIEGMLVLARSDRGLRTKQPVRLDELAEAVVVAHRSSAEQAGVALHATLQPRVVHGDRVLLGQLVTNLVENAIKYNQVGGEVWVSIGADPALRVGNTGPAVPAAVVPELFEPFRQLRRSPTSADRGVGLGLSIVASITRAHAGAVRAAPRDGGGLDVLVTLPDARPTTD